MAVRSALLLAGLVVACTASVPAFAQYYPPGPVYPPRPIGPPVFADDGVPPGYVLGEERVPTLPAPPPGLRAPDDRADLMRQGPYGPPPSPPVTEVQPLPPLPPPVVIGPEQPRQYGSAPAPQYGAAPAPDYQTPAQPGYGAPARDQSTIYRPPGDIVGSTQQSVLSALPPEERPEVGPTKELPPHLRRQLVNYRTKEPAGTLIVDTANTYLYLVLGGGQAMRYGIGVGREGFTWAGQERISKMAEWPDWTPPDEMVERQPYLPRFMAGGPGNPLGARALYLGKSLYRIHGTNQPSTIGTFVSSGCIRLLNDDIADLYQRVQVGSRVVVLPGKPPSADASAMR